MMITVSKRTAAVISIALLVSLVACSPDGADRAARNNAQLELGPTRVLALPSTFRRPALFASKDALYLVQYGLGSVTASVSRDRGGSWHPILGGPRPGTVCEYDPRVDDFHVLHLQPGGIDHEVLLGSERSALARVADISSGHLGHLVFRCFPDGQLGVAWTDSSSGWPQVLFSSSSDHGNSWSVPAVVESPSRPAEVFAPFLDRQAGRWYMIWPENQGRSTLFDIHLATSEDGRSWVHGPRINDDQSKAWNWLPASCGNSSNLFVAFSDYRERDGWGEPDENVYFARLPLASGNVGPNRRLNDAIKGTQSYPRIALDQDSGRVISVWLDTRDRLTRDVFASFSDDSGETWSANQKVTGNQGRQTISRPELAQVPGGNFCVGWTQISKGIAEFHLREVLGTVPQEPTQAGRQRAWEAASEAPASVEQQVEQSISPSEYSLERVDRVDFIGHFSRRWTPVSGSWLINGAAVIGFGKSPPYLNWRGEELADFAVEGRFRLNRLRHYDASLIFRAQPGGDGRPLRGFMLRNHFRQGVWLVASDSGFDNWESTGVVVAEAAFPFRSDTWYRFRLVVKGDRLDYYVDDRLTLSSGQVSAWRKGGFSLSTGGSPAEFEEIRLYRLKATDN